MAISNFKLDCCRLFDLVPLYAQRKSIGDSGKYRLHVFIMGFGDRMETIFNAVLTQGQLLDTELYVTVAVPNPSLFTDRLIESAPALPNFVRITCGDRVFWSGSENYMLADITVIKASFKPEMAIAILGSIDKPDYVLVSGGNDEKNLAIASAVFDELKAGNTVTACVRKKNDALSGETGIVFFGGKESEEYGSAIENIAFNLHYAYAKGADERKPYSEIKKEFEDPYIYVSNIEAAVCIKSKLGCCGITTADPKEAAQRFSYLIKTKPEMVERLGAVEHARWVIEKTLQGFKQLENIDLIYQNGDTTKSTASKWHSCLVSSNREGASSIKQEQWKAAQKKGPDSINAEKFNVDELDAMSLRIHSKCYQLSRANADYVDSLLLTLRSYFGNHAAFSDETRRYLDIMDAAITQMRLKKFSAVSLYRTYFDLLSTHIDNEARDNLTMLKNTLNNLRTALEPLIEYISFKDYKGQDRLLIRSIPFALTHIPAPKVLKILCSSDAENIISAWMLEPSSVTYLACAHTVGEYEMLRSSCRAPIEFIRQQFGNSCKISRCFFVPGDPKKTPHIITENDIEDRIHFLRSFGFASFVAEAERVIRELKPDYIDLSGAGSLLSFAVQQAAERCGASSFYVDNGVLRNIDGCPQLEYPAPEKSFYIREMFKMAGGIFEESGAENRFKLNSVIKAFWKIAAKNENWTELCKKIDAAYRNSHRPFYFTYDKSSARGIEALASAEASSAILSTLRKLEEYGCIEKLSVNNDYSGMKRISLRLFASDADCNAFEAFIRNSCAHYKAGDRFTVVKAGGRKIELTHYTMLVSGLSVDNIAEDDLNSYTGDANESSELPEMTPGENIEGTEPNEELDDNRKTLKALARSNIIYDLTENNDQFSFRFANSEVYRCLTISGALLEHYIYYSAILDGSFTDVDIGFSYRHSSIQNAASNELDVICTKGARSLFISCKHVSLKMVNYYLKYYFYEIKLQAELFGVNAKPVLVIPALDQFSKKDGVSELSKEVKRALSRGVYLIGKECLNGTHLGRVLDNIICGMEDWCGFINDDGEKGNEGSVNGNPNETAKQSPHR